MSPPPVARGSLHISDPAIQGQIQSVQTVLAEIGYSWSVSKIARTIKEYLDRRPPMPLMEYIARKIADQDHLAASFILPELRQENRDLAAGGTSVGRGDITGIAGVVSADGDGWWRDRKRKA